MTIRNAEPVDRLVAALLAEPDEQRVTAMLVELDAVADAVWWVEDRDYAAVALQEAAGRARSPQRRTTLLRHALSRAMTYAAGATSGGEGLARSLHVEEIRSMPNT